MALTLTDAQLTQIANAIFILKQPAPPALPKPANTTGAKSLAVRLDPIKAQPEFKDLSIGVVDFTADRMDPKIWLHQEDESWRMCSAGKLAILLAAAQLREDVRAVRALNIVTTAADFDDLFALPKLWKQSKDSKLHELGKKANAPRLSTMFDFSGAVPDYIGASTPLDKQKISDIGDVELGWPGVPALTMWERLNLTGTQSDNVAATTCVSEIGVDYMKAVQRAYGLFAPKKGKGMTMMLSQAYGQADVRVGVTSAAGAPKYRRLQNVESDFRVNDVYQDPITGPTRATGQSGSVAALTAYMIALMQDKLGVGKTTCDMIRTHLADVTGLALAPGPTTTRSLIVDGVHASGATVTKCHTKLGILGPLRCEFAYLEADGHKYAVIGMGILPRAGIDEVARGRKLGKDIHAALIAPP
jgi:hypothetical protein